MSREDTRFWNESIERMNRSKLEEIQGERLRELVKRLYESVPFYRRKLKGAGIDPSDVRGLPDLRKLPFTSKDELRENYPFGLLAVPKSELVEVHMTSGTTGIPTPNFLTLKDVETWGELIARSLYMGGLRKGDVFQITPSFSLFTGGFSFFYGARKIGSFIVPTGPGNSKRQIELMKELGTTSFASIVSYAVRLTEVAREMGIDPSRDLGVRRIFMGSEMSTPQLKRRLMEAWSADVFDAYGQTETYGGPSVGLDCHLHDGIHVWEDHFLVEIVDPKTGEPVGNEEKGELVVTTLTKDAMPLLRYRTRDITFIYDAVEHDCGRTHRRIGWIEGRTDDMIKYRGVNFWPSFIESIILKYDELSEHYQVELFSERGSEYMVIKIEAKNVLQEGERRRLSHLIEDELRRRFMFEAKVEITEPHVLPRFETGKAKRVIDNRERKI
ncbi:phenylacetate-coenzyme A ligase [Sulfodiicoccus acidiphilus]|uniref:Phenylacetate-coenzyme A ligase n=1 Tax=Sulfodiicoccus acidiphilus TaxID=1670455 RepID=A0A348B1K1_9CREN|nr:phenylacetate--CoA ligase [Sulfodiicoccus acidiphilus]BBD72053.1 phenylacetate-coenzyme A ligase [Sulfodiicoccus acidiphilus]GGU00118.1 phenylacetate-coenzyme A ligase [Sulfodiicoccus acidiphilus]